MTTEANAHENKDTNTDLKRRAGLSWVGLCSVRVVFAVFLAALTVLCGCNLFGGVSPSASMAQKVATAIEKTDKVEQDIQGVGGDLTQIKNDLTELNNTVITMQTQITNTHNENESLKSLMITVALIIGGFCVLFVALYLIVAKVAPGKTLWNIICPWRMVKK